MDKLMWLEASIAAAANETACAIENDQKGVQDNLYRFIRLVEKSLPMDLKGELFALEEEINLNLRLAIEASYRKGFEQGFTLFK